MRWEEINPTERNYFILKMIEEFEQEYRAHTATHGYTEEDIKDDFLTSLRPQMMWCEIEEKPMEEHIDKHGDLRNNKTEHKFKSRDGELVVIEWE